MDTVYRFVGAFMAGSLTLLFSLLFIIAALWPVWLAAAAIKYLFF